MAGFVRRSAFALIVGAVLLMSLNVVLTPLLPQQGGEATLRTSVPYLIRSAVAIGSALFMLIGIVGVHLASRDKGGVFGAVAFGTLFIGTVLVVAVEWSNLFIMRSLAEVTPGALEPLGDVQLLNVGLATGLGLFVVGWVLLSVNLLRTKVVPWRAPTAILLGLVSIAGLGAMLGSVGAIIGNLVWGLGLVDLGRQVAAGQVIE